MRFKNPSYPKQLNIGHGHLKNSTKIRISQGWPNSWQSTPLAIWVYAQFLHLQAFSGFKEHPYSEELYLLINKCKKWRIFNLALKQRVAEWHEGECESESGWAFESWKVDEKTKKWKHDEMGVALIYRVLVNRLIELFGWMYDFWDWISLPNSLHESFFIYPLLWRVDSHHHSQLLNSFFF